MSSHKSQKVQLSFVSPQIVIPQKKFVLFVSGRNNSVYWDSLKTFSNPGSGYVNKRYFRIMTITLGKPHKKKVHPLVARPFFSSQFLD